MRPLAFQIARPFGIPVRVHFSWLFVFALIAWMLAAGFFPAMQPAAPAWFHWAEGVAAALLFFASILLHELAHALVARRNGLAVQSITLFVFGGVSRFEREASGGGVEVAVALAGPILSLALALGFRGLAAVEALGDLRAVATQLALANLILAIFNLVPAFPLDGGRILRGLLWSSLGRVRATRIAAGAGNVFSLALVAAGIFNVLGGRPLAGVWYLLLGWFLNEAATGAYHEARLDQLLHGVTVRDAMLHEVATLPSDVSLREAIHEHFLRTGYGGYPVVRGDAVVGLLSLRDVLAQPPHERDTTSVQAAMAPLSDALVVDPGEPLLQAVARMSRQGSGRLLVMEGGRLAGLLTMSAVLRHVRMRELLA